MDIYYIIFIAVMLGVLLFIGIPFALITNIKYPKVKNGLVDKCDKVILSGQMAKNSSNHTSQNDKNSILDDEITNPAYSCLPYNIYHK